MADVYFDSSIQTEYLDPVSFVPGLRCRFELDGTKMAYLSNMRLLDIGVVSGALHTYNRGLGALALIKNIRLLDGRTELSALRNPAQYLFFKNANRTNAINDSNDGYLKRHQLGFQVKELDNKIATIFNRGQADTTDANTAKAYLDLREVFPILNTLRVLPTELFQNLQIEIEFNPKERDVLADTSSGIAPVRPILAVDTISNEVMVRQEINAIAKNGVVWDEIEWDSFVIPEVDTSGFGAAVTAKAYLDLREVFPILNTLRVLPTELFQNLQIEIEFNPKERDVLADTSSGIAPVRPILAVDTISNEVMVRQEINAIAKNGVVWDEIEWDSFVIPEVDTSGFGAAVTATQNVSNQSLGFKGKYVERLLLCKQLQDITKASTGTIQNGFGGVASSQALLNQTTQYRLNGKNVLPGFNGISGQNERLGVLSDEWGSVNSYPGSNLYAWSKGLENVQTGDKLNGQMSWDCVRLGARVADLVVNISRTNNLDASAQAATNDGIVCNLYGEVRKAMALGASAGASYRIVYA